MDTPLFASLSAWTLGLIPAFGSGRSGNMPGPSLPEQREKTVRLPMDPDDAPSSLFLPAGPGPHPAMLLDASDRATNLRAEAHRFASIGIAAFFRDVEDDGAPDPLTQVVLRADYLRDRLDINPYELGALCVGEPAVGWLETIAACNVAFLIRVTVRPDGLPLPGTVRESAAPGGTPLLDVVTAHSPLEPEVTRLVDAWLLRHVTIRS